MLAAVVSRWLSICAALVLPAGAHDHVAEPNEIDGCCRPARAGRSAGTTRLLLGAPETIHTVAEARRLALAMLGKVAAGGDPAVEREERNRREHSRIGELLYRYEKDLGRRNYVDRSTVMSRLRLRMAGKGPHCPDRARVGRCHRCMPWRRGDLAGFRFPQDGRRDEWMVRHGA